MSSMTKTETPTVGINVQLPAALHKQVRMKAFDKGLTLEKAIAAAAAAWVKAR